MDCGAATVERVLSPGRQRRRANVVFADIPFLGKVASKFFESRDKQTSFERLSFSRLRSSI